MTSSFSPLKVRQRLMSYYKGVSIPAEFGPDGWLYTSANPQRSFIVTVADHPEDGQDWLHASVAADQMPDYRDLTVLHAAVFPGYAYQVFAPKDMHVNIHEHALHLWGRLDGTGVLPDFTMGGGSI